MNGHVYVLKSEPIGENRVSYYKIGMTTDLASRIKQLPIQLPFAVELIHTIPCDDPAGEEARLHSLLGAFRVNGEWFDLPDEIVGLLRLIRWLPRGQNQLTSKDQKMVSAAILALPEFVADYRSRVSASGGLVVSMRGRQR